MIAAVVPAALSRGDATDAIPGVVRKACATCATAALSCARGSATASWSGPLVPGPNPFASRSYACRVVWPAGSLPASLDASRSPRAGAASASISAVAAIAVTPGAAGRAPPSEARSRVARRRSASRRPRRPPVSPTRRPTRLSSAGSNVSDALKHEHDADRGRYGGTVEQAHAEREHPEQCDHDRRRRRTGPRGRRC